MARKKETNREDNSSSSFSKDLLDGYLQKYKDSHLNFEDRVDYVVSTGSIYLDIATNGGIRPSVFRSTGVTEGGKTSFNLSLMGNFLKMDNARGVLIKSEGRLSSLMFNKYDFLTYDQNEWNNGKCFVLETNVLEACFRLINELVLNNPEKIKYCFIIDSLDALVPEEALKKDISEAWKVGSAAGISSRFLAAMANKITRLGHIVSIISQVRSRISINPYEKGDPKVTNASGGNAPLHYSDWILEFQPKHKKNLIFSKDEKTILGHNCHVIFRKSATEKTGTSIYYPVKYGVKRGISVWREREIGDVLLTLGLVNSKGAWTSVDEEIVSLLKENEIEMPDKFNGLDKFYAFLEENPKAADILTEKMKKDLQTNCDPVSAIT